MKENLNCCNCMQEESKSKSNYSGTKKDIQVKNIDKTKIKIKSYEKTKLEKKTITNYVHQNVQ